LVVGVCLVAARRVLERPREYLTECVGAGDGDGVVNCSRAIRQGVSSLSCGWGAVGKVGSNSDAIY
jgi:hypothetical protein